MALMFSRKFSRAASGDMSSSASMFTKTRDEVVMVTRLSSMLRSSWSSAPSIAW